MIRYFTPYNESVTEECTVFASVSGGKDSTAMSLWLTEQGIAHSRVFADTGWEHPKTYEYIEYLQDALGYINVIKGEFSMVELIRDKHSFPINMQRFCTTELKVRPLYEHFLKESAKSGVKSINAIGIRGGESKARSLMEEWDGYVDQKKEFGGGMFWIWRPIITWSVEDVITIHKRHNIKPNPLYLMGAERVGCWPCINSGKKGIRLVGDNDPERIDLIRSLEKEINANLTDGKRTFFRRNVRINGVQTATQIPIDDAVAWSRTNVKGEEVEAEENNSCVQWGLCES